jgi:hypothetical protein
MLEFKTKHEATDVLDNRHSFHTEGTTVQNQENITQVKGKAISVTDCRGPQRSERFRLPHLPVRLSALRTGHPLCPGRILVLISVIG